MVVINARGELRVGVIMLVLLDIQEVVAVLDILKQEIMLEIKTKRIG